MGRPVPAAFGSLLLLQTSDMCVCCEIRMRFLHAPQSQFIAACCGVRERNLCDQCARVIVLAFVPRRRQRTLVCCPHRIDANWFTLCTWRTHRNTYFYLRCVCVCVFLLFRLAKVNCGAHDSRAWRTLQLSEVRARAFECSATAHVRARARPKHVRI